MKVIAVVKKHYDFIELEEIINRSNSKHLCLCIYTNEKLCNFTKKVAENLHDKFCVKVEKIECHFFNLNDVKSGRDIYNSISTFVKEKSIVALPLANSRYFVQAAGLFNNSANAIVFHISDGILDHIPRYKYYLTRCKLNIKGISRSVIQYINLINKTSDYSYSVFSNYSAFSKETIKISPNFNYKKLTIKNLEIAIPQLRCNAGLILLMPTKAVNIDLLISEYKLEDLVDQIIVTAKTGEITYNKKTYWLNGPVTAEEMLQTGYFHKVYSGPSTAAFYARQLDSRIRVSMLSTYSERSNIGYMMDRWLRKEALKNEINYKYLSEK